MTTLDKVNQEAPVFAALIRMRASCNRLEEKLMGLEARLTPILTLVPSQPNAGTTAVESNLNVSGTIGRLTEAIESRIKQIEDIQSRLEV